jgi:heptaprenyl diphosphate synthase
VVAGGGKRLRPALTLAVADVGKTFDPRVVAAAVAVELVQVGSLVHDDIFDDAETRRGTPTINAVEGQNQALLAGTYLMARAAAEAATAGQEVASDVARTVALLCVGQTTETQHLFDIGQEIDRYLFTIEAKTAALFACSCRVGALSAELPDEHVNRFGEFGKNFGMAFQLIDDVLDLIGDPDRLGKPVGADMRCGVLTMPALLELAQPNGGDLRALLLRRQAADVEQASRMIVNSGRIDEVIDVARQYAAEASAAIADVPGTSDLSRFPLFYLDWALEEFVVA